jgi:hypothetical protein
MLPILSFRIRRNLVACSLALALTLPAAPSFAWGQHEQGLLAGAVGALAIAGIIQANKNQQRGTSAPVYVQPQLVYAAPPVHQPQRVSAARTPAAYAFSSYSSGERRAIQRSLARAGYYFGAIDGAFGPGTYNATAAFARDTGAASAFSSQAGAYGLYDRLLYGAH